MDIQELYGLACPACGWSTFAPNPDPNVAYAPVAAPRTSVARCAHCTGALEPFTLTVP